MIRINLNVNLNLSTNNSTFYEQKKRVAKATKTKKEANKPIPEQIDDLIKSLKKPLNEKEQVFFNLAKDALMKGTIERKKDGKLTKTEMISLGKEIKQKQEQIERSKRAREVLETKPDNFYILRDDKELPKFIDRLREECRLQRECWKDLWLDLGVKSLIAWDIEGTGTDWFMDLSIGISCWLPILNEGYYLPYGHVEGIEEMNGQKIPEEFRCKDETNQLTRSKVIEAIKPYMEAPSEGKSFHMGAPRYDLHMALNDGYRIKGAVFDSLNAMYLLNEFEDSYGLKQLVQKYGKYFGIDSEVYTFEDLFGNGSPAPYDIELVGIYAIKDVMYGWKLTEWQITMMQQTDNLWKCYTRIDSKLPETDVFLQRCGFEIDLVALKQLEVEFETKLEQAKRDLFAAYNIDADFIDRMNRTINKDKIKKWKQQQKKRIEKWEERLEKLNEEIKQLEQQGKTHLKKYTNLKQQLRKHYERKPARAITSNYPDAITEFSLTNRNHIGYLIYDHLRIEDITPQVDPGKKRGTSKDVLDKYFEMEKALKPLANVAKYEKLLSTYVRSIPNNLDADGRLHSLFDATGTRTGRYASRSYSGRALHDQ